MTGCKAMSFNMLLKHPLNGNTWISDTEGGRDGDIRECHSIHVDNVNPLKPAFPSFSVGTLPLDPPLWCKGRVNHIITTQLSAEIF
jgi:hypothetical protein